MSTHGKLLYLFMVAGYKLRMYLFCCMSKCHLSSWAYNLRRNFCFHNQHIHEFFSRSDTPALRNIAIYTLLIRFSFYNHSNIRDKFYEVSILHGFTNTTSAQFSCLLPSLSPLPLHSWNVWNFPQSTWTPTHVGSSLHLSSALEMSWYREPGIGSAHSVPGFLTYPIRPLKYHIEQFIILPCKACFYLRK